MPQLLAAFTTAPPYPAAAYHVARFDNDYINRAAARIGALDSVVATSH